MPALVISLDFEMFWGVTDSKTIENYGANIEGEWQSVPGILKLFKKYDIHATWATVGMLMCKDYEQWRGLRPTVMPTYDRESQSAYSAAELARNFPKLFFARPLVEQILTTDGQELACHTYSHFYCGEAGATPEQFAADIKCAQIIFNEYGVKPTSLVFPRNQMSDEYLNQLSGIGFTAYRGNEEHWLYRDGHRVSGSSFKRLARAGDAYFPLTGNHISMLPDKIPADQLMNIPASSFLRPSSGHPVIDKLLSHRIEGGMLEAAKANGVFHLWWHPHNFGQNTEANLKNLEQLLKYYCLLNQVYGMRSLSMKELRNSC